jgi:hypothetical protein
MVGLRTQLAIERAGLEIPHLKRGAPDFYPSAEVFEVGAEDAWAHPVFDVHAVQMRAALGTHRKQSDAFGSGEECQQTPGKAIGPQAGGIS